MEKKQGKRGKRPASAPATRLRRTVAANIRGLMEQIYPLAKYTKKSYQEQAFARDAGVSWSSVQRVLNPHSGQTLDVIADLAVALHVKSSDLLIEDFASPKNTSESKEKSPFQEPDLKKPSKRSTPSSRNPTY
jgi:hypothetical protein